MSGEERFGEWHVLVIERQDANPDEPELDWTVQHLASCPQERQAHGMEYACSLAAEITHAGYEAFEEPGDPLGPGRYRVRTWARSSYVPSYGTTEWDAGVEVEPIAIPRRGDAIEGWLRARREDEQRDSEAWDAIDGPLDLYRLHADTGTPLDRHVCENGNVDDCAGCYEEAQR